MRFKIVGDHPIFARPDKTFDNHEDAAAYYHELFEFGYDNLEMVPVYENDDLNKLSEKVLPDVLRSNFKLLNHVKKMCTGCRKMYVPVMDNDGDCCPSCARY